MSRYNLPPHAMYGPDHPRWKGGRRKVGAYIQVKAPDHPYANKRGYVFEHRLVMEKVLGRYLDPKEVVHHVNGDKMDNRPENLEIFVNQGDHNHKHFSGKPHSYSTKGRKNPKISEIQRGRHHSKEWNQRISEGHKATPQGRLEGRKRNEKGWLLPTSVASSDQPVSEDHSIDQCP